MRAYIFPQIRKIKIKACENRFGDCASFKQVEIDALTFGIAEKTMQIVHVCMDRWLIISQTRGNDKGNTFSKLKNRSRDALDEVVDMLSNYMSMFR